ncbi:MAG: hypothetical protein ACXWH7_11055 [Thermoanaerobaculia bacterium]
MAVVLDEDVADVFQSSEAVNELLRSVIKAMPPREPRATPPPKRRAVACAREKKRGCARGKGRAALAASQE